MAKANSSDSNVAALDGDRLMAAQPAAQGLHREFLALAAQWREETAGHSVITPKVAHPAYLRIIGMGPVALPWILRELEEHGGHWYVALQSITGANPVPHEDRGRIPKMRAAWLRWAREEGWLD